MVTSLVLLNVIRTILSRTFLRCALHHVSTRMFLRGLVSCFFARGAVVVFFARLAFMPGPIVDDADFMVASIAFEDGIVASTEVNLARFARCVYAPAEIGVFTQSLSSVQGINLPIHSKKRSVQLSVSGARNPR